MRNLLRTDRPSTAHKDTIGWFAMDFPSKPNDRREFKVAIICALSLEADMVEMVFDKDWSNEGMKYGKAAKDSNAYTTGVIAGHNVVLAYCPGIGKNAAAQVATSMKTSFTGIRLALVVGICGAVPFYKNQEDETEEIVLGDCIISTSVVQFDFGRLGPSGFQKKDGLDTRGLANAELRGLMAKLKSRKNVSHMTKQLETHLKVIQKEDPKRAKYPGYTEDRLYEAPYIHTHHDGAEKCEKCNLKLGICDMECKILGCSDNNLINRNRLSSDACPQLHFGCFGSSDTVVKSGLHREELAKADEIIAFEMEGSGVWDVLPTVSSPFTGVSLSKIHAALSVADAGCRLLSRPLATMPIAIRTRNGKVMLQQSLHPLLKL